MAIFSYTLGIIRSFKTDSTSNQILENKMSNAINFLNEINKARETEQLPREVIDDAIKHLEVMYKYQVSYLFDTEDLYQQMGPRLRNNLSFE